MKTSFKNIRLLLAGLALCACSEDFLNGGIDGNDTLPIVLGAAYPTVTRASDDGFEHGDRMGVYVADYDGNTPEPLTDAGVRASNVMFTFEGTDNSWQAATSVYWRDAKTPADIVAYYPYMEALDNPAAMPFSILRRQDVAGTETSLGGYENSDLLWAKATKAMPTAERVNLTFNHMMAGVRVTLREGTGFAQGEWNEAKKVVLVANVMPDATVDLERGTVGAASGTPISVTPYIYNNDWRAVVVPQTVAAGSSVVDISVDGKAYHLKKNEAMTYVPGKMHTFTVTVDKRGDSGDYEFTLNDESIMAWVDDVDFRDGIVRNYLVVDVPKRGTLKDVIAQKGYAPSAITGLKLTGEINDDDFTFMREDCSALNALNLSDVTVWGDGQRNVIPYRAMYEKETLAHIVFPKNLKEIKNGAFYHAGLMGSLIIPEGVEIIGELCASYGVFNGCQNLIGNLSLPSTIKIIGERAFSSTNLSGRLVLPESLKIIGNDAFYRCKFTGELNLPQKISQIGSFAFWGNSFTGDLFIPSSFKKIENNAFGECCFDGILSLSEGLKEIDAGAFYKCNFKGELMLPSTLQSIGAEAFRETRFNSVVMPEKLVMLGDGAFRDCRHLRGTIEIPKKLFRINEYLFCGCSLLDGLILHEDVVFVGGAALYGCKSLNKLVCRNSTPPLVNSVTDDDLKDLPIGPFDDLSKGNFTLEVPKQSIEKYKRADGWKEFGRVAEYANFSCRPATACALNSQHSETIVLDSDGEWEVKEKPSWCSLSVTSGSNRTSINLTIDALAQGGENRTGKIVFSLKGTDVTTECNVSQYDYKYAEDECITLQKATAGEGIDVLFVGDGWDAEAIASGKYLELVKKQMEAFFGIEPYTTYRDHFNVYACVSLSQETGVNTPSIWRNTKFGTFYTYGCDGNGAGLLVEIDNVFDYAVAHSPLTQNRMWKSLVIMSLNNDEYGGATMLTQDGSAVAICSPSEDTYPMDTRGIVQHEACGHAFGKLAEERISVNGYLCDSEINAIRKYQRRDWYQNISLVGGTKDVHWSHLIFDPRYSDAVDVFEGAYGKTRGVYRAEINSCMNYGIPYFSAISRQDIMKRILEYSGEGFTMDKFYATDSDKWGATEDTRAAKTRMTQGYAASGRHQEVKIVKSKKY